MQDSKPNWLKDYELFVEELLINFSLYDALVDVEAELNQLAMKENHKVVEFFINFVWLPMLCDYNDRALLWKAYMTLLKRICKCLLKQALALSPGQLNSTSMWYFDVL